MEHPADPGRAPFPSIWDTERYQSFAEASSMHLVTFDQCCLGSSSRKPTSLSGSSDVLMDWSRFVCRHRGHPELIGRGPDGSFRTKSAQAYPPLMCKELAEMHLKEFLRRGPRRAPRPVSQRELAEAGAEAAARLGEHLPIPPIGLNWDPLDRWVEICRWTWAQPEHINVLEARTALAAVRRAARSRKNWGRRVMLFVDSQVTLCSLAKGRSSRPGLNHVCRRVCAHCLAFDLKVLVRWVPTKRNHADGPSRGEPLGIAGGTCEARVRLPDAHALLPEAFASLAG